MIDKQHKGEIRMNIFKMGCLAWIIMIGISVIFSLSVMGYFMKTAADVLFK
jgi:hypothetical protein